MQISPITSYYQKPSFKAINQKYFHKAIEDIKLTKSVSCDWYQMMGYEVNLFKTISIQDGIDTVRAVKELMGCKKDIALDILLKGFQNSND